jgi:hypothetical protein
MKISDLKEVKIDNVDGWGAVPWNQNVEYMGLRVLMKPTKFLLLAETLPSDAYPDIVNHIKNDGAIGAPFLCIRYPYEWESNDFKKNAFIASHEGRNRMKAILKVKGDVFVETHLFFSTIRYVHDEETGEKIKKIGEVRARHLTPEIIDRLNYKLIREEPEEIAFGPFFKQFK